MSTMNRFLTIDGKRYHALDAAAALTGNSVERMQELYASGRLMGRQIGKVLYIEDESLRNTPADERASAEVGLATVESVPQPVIEEVVSIVQEAESATAAEEVAPRVELAAALLTPVPRELGHIRVMPGRKPTKRINRVRARSLLTTLAAVVVAMALPAAAMSAYPHVAALAKRIGDARGQAAAAATSQGASAVSPVAPSPSVLQAANAFATVASSTAASSSAAVQPIYYVYNYPVIERIKYESPSISATSSADFSAQLQAMYDRIQSQILLLSQNTGSQLAQTYQVVAQTNRIDQLSGTRISNPTITGGSISGVSFAASDLSGAVGIANGGTGTSTAPAYGQLLLGNASGTYDLVATSSLGISGGGGVSLSAANTWTALQLFSAGASSTAFSNFGTAYFGGTATTTIDSAGNLSVAGTLGVSGKSSFAQASTTLFSSLGTAYFGGSATSTFDSAGNLSVAGTLGVTGNTTLANATSTTLFATIASSTNLFSTNATLGTLSAGTLSLTSALTVAQGGTGAVTLTGLLKGNGTSAFTAAAAGTDYVAPATTISAGTGLSGGGDLSTNRTLTLDLTNANSWTGLQTFANASSSHFSTFQYAYFGGTATSTFDSAGNLSLVSNGLTVGTSQLVVSGGNVGIGTTTPSRKLSVTDTVATAQTAIAYDTTRYAEFRVDSTGDLNIEPSGGDLYFNNDNLWSCTGGSISSNGCPSGAPTGFGNIIAENKLGIGTSTPAYKLSIETQDGTTNFFQIASSTAQDLLVVNANGRVGIGTSTPFAKLSVGPNGSIVTTENSLVDAATITVSWLDGNQQKVTLGGNRTVNFSNYIAGQVLRLVVCQDATGSRTVTWDSAVLWQGGTAPTLTTTADKCDLATFVATGATSTLKVLGAAALAF